MSESIYQRFSETELLILKARADRLARLTKDHDQEERLTVLSVKVGSERCALPISAIANVYEGLNITRVPGVPSGVAGITNVHGRLVLVLDLKTLLNVPGLDSDSHVLVTLVDDDLDLALLVDGVSDIETIPSAALSLTPPTVDLHRTGHIVGIFADGMALVDLASLIHDSRFAAATALSGRIEDSTYSNRGQTR